MARRTNLTRDLIRKLGEIIFPPQSQPPPPSTHTTRTPVYQWKHPSPQSAAGEASSPVRASPPAISCSGQASV